MKRALILIALVVGVLLLIKFQPWASNPAPSGGQPYAASAPAPIPDAMQAGFDRGWLQRPRVPVEDVAMGAKVMVVMWVDWQCPGCRAVHQQYIPVVDQINAQLGGQPVRVITHDYPLNGKCNAYVPGVVHVAPCEAAVAVRLAAEHGNRQRMIDWLFANQMALTPEMVKDGAKSVGGVTDFDARYESVMEDVKKDIDAGHRAGAQGTPWVLVNGVLARGGDGHLFSTTELRLAINAELKKP